MVKLASRKVGFVNTASIGILAGRAWKNPLRRKHLILSVVLLCLAWADSVISGFIVKNGYASEANPLLREHVTDSNFGIIKIIGTLLALMILWDVSRRYPRLALVFIQVFAALYTMIVWWNVYLAGRGIFQ
jgi:putative copper export protein